MNLFDCISSAEKDITDARRHLEKGCGVNWVCDEIYSAMVWAMEAWIIGKGYEPDTRNGWSSIHVQFSQLTPKKLRPASYCAAKAVMMDYELQGGPDYNEKPIPFAKWKKMAFELIDKAEQCIIAIEKDSGCGEEQLKELWLYRKYHEE